MYCRVVGVWCGLVFLLLIDLLFVFTTLADWLLSDWCLFSYLVCFVCCLVYGCLLWLRFVLGLLVGI